MRGEREGVISTDILSAIKEILKENPKGASVTDLSKMMAMNRNSVAKYLDILLISGQVEMRSYGTAKVYYLSHRVPISTLLCFSSDFIAVVDARHTIIQISDNFLTYAHLERECVVGKTVQESGLPLISAPELLPYILATPDRDITRDIRHERNGEESYFTVKLIPTVFDDGSRGVTAIIEDTTSRIRYERALAASEEKYRGLVERNFDLVITLDRQGWITYVSPSSTRISGYTPEEVLGRNFADQCGAALEQSTDLFNRVIAGEVVVGAEKQLPQRDGTVSFVEINAFPIRENGVIVGAQAIIRDMSKRKAAEFALQESEHRFREATELSPFPIAIIEADGKYSFINRKFVEVFGYTLSDVPTGREWFRKAFPDLEIRREAISTWLADRDTASPGEIRPRTFSVTCKDLSVREVIFRPVTLFDGREYITYEDITERSQAEASLKKSEEQLRSILDNSLDALYRRNLLTDSFDYFSPAVERITGFSVREVLTWDADAILKRIHPDDQPRVASEKIATPSTVTQRTIDYRFLCRDGTYKWLSDRFRFTYDAQDRPLVREGILRDITERNQAEEEIKASYRLMHDVIDFLPDATFVIDENNRVLAWNRAMENLTGVSRDEMLGRGDYAYAVPFYGKPRPVLIDLIDTKDPIAGEEYKSLRREGSTIIAEGYISFFMRGRRVFLQGMASPLMSADGHRIGAIESIRDITPHREAEERLARAGNDLEKRIEERTRDLVLTNESHRDETARSRSMKEALLEEEQRFQALVDTIHDVLLIANSEGRIEYANPRAATLLRKKQNTIVGKPLSALFPIETAEGMQETIRKAIATGKTIQRKRWIMAGEHERWFDSTVAPLRDAAGAQGRVIIFASDITPIAHCDVSRLSEMTSKENSSDPRSPSDPRSGAP
jgi:PAS domain S-box-containing protein